MKIIIKGEAKEIADLVLAVQDRQQKDLTNMQLLMDKLPITASGLGSRD